MQYYLGATRRSGRVFLASLVIACTGVLISFSACSPSRKSAPGRFSELRPEVAGSGLQSAPSGQSNRPIYPFSLVPGGVRDGDEIAAVRATDAVLRSHYSEVGPRLIRETMARDEWLYTSYRVGASVYWTKHAVRVRAGEAVLSDGVHMIRARCGNRLSAVPNKPTRLVDPPSVLEDTPAVASEQKPPEAPFADQRDGGSGGGDPEDSLLGLPGQTANPTSHPLPSDLAQKPQLVTTTRQTINGPAAALLGARANATAAAITAPEPGTWATMLGGLGIIGCIARRRRKPAGS